METECNGMLPLLGIQLLDNWLNIINTTYSINPNPKKEPNQFRNSA